MSSTISGLGSGFDINGWVSQLVSVKQSSMVLPLEEKLSTLQTKSTALTSLKSKYSTLQRAIKDFTNTIYNSSSDIWNKTKINTSNSAYATATSSGSVSAAKVDLIIEQVATATTAKSVKSLGSISIENIKNAKFTNIANGQGKLGTFSMFLNGKEYGIKIEDGDTFGGVLDKIKTASNGLIQAKIDNNGFLSINAYKENILDNGTKEYVIDESAQLSLGSSGDSSNFLTALKLHNKTGEYSYSSSYPVSTINTSAAIGDSESGLSGIKFFDENGAEAENGKVVINGVEIEVNKNTTLDDLISRINGNSDTNVKASYDSLTDRLVLTSTQTGQSNISLSSKGTNLLNVLGLTQGEGNDEILAVGSQELGQNAIAYINGNKVISTSNTITGESSGIANLSITLKKQTSDYSGNTDDDKTVTLDIEPDYTTVKEKFQKFVDAYNAVIETTSKMTKSDGDIGRDSSLNSILSNLKSITSDVSSNDGAFSMLAQIGITSDKNDVSKLTIDSSKLDEALSENLDSVKRLISDGYVSKDDNGIFDGLLKDLNVVLDSEKGYFVSQSESVQSQINNMNKRLERANTRLLSYQERITKQFNAMDATISNLNAQMSSFSSILS